MSEGNILQVFWHAGVKSWTPLLLVHMYSRCNENGGRFATQNSLLIASYNTYHRRLDYWPFALHLKKINKQKERNRCVVKLCISLLRYLQKDSDVY